jgi:PD-(D/E)XK nuclease superfamily
MKSTLVVSGAGAAASARLALARDGRCGTEVRSIGQAVARLAGGFLGEIETDALADACSGAITSTSHEELGDLVGIAELPGLAIALAATLRKAWNADIDLPARAVAQPGSVRLATLARLEASVLEQLPLAMLRPAELVRRALVRRHLAPTVLGRVTCRNLPDIAPCWRPFLLGLAEATGLVWESGPRPVPGWVEAAGLPVETATAETPELRVMSCATARHEVIEAMRWARSLLAGGTVQAQDIAIAAATPGEFDDLVLALGFEANLAVYFAHGRRALTTRAGQAAAALADILLHGLSQDRVRRLAALAREADTPFGALPEGWARTLPRGAPLTTPARWRQALADTPTEVSDPLFRLVDLLAEGLGAAKRAGETVLRGQAGLFWRAALAEAPASVLEASLGALRIPDKTEPGSSIAWMHAATLAACPRPHAWLLGLNARNWPRLASEDPLLPNHVVPREELDWMPVTQADRAAFHAIRATTTVTLTFSASRRDATGRVVGLSPLLPPIEPVRLRRSRVPEHAMSEQDRMMARPTEFAATSRACSANDCWQDWRKPEITPHDGLMRANHPVLVRVIRRVHSAHSLRMLLRSPIGFLWNYALGWRKPDDAAETMDFDPATFGSLVHDILDDALPRIEATGGLSRASPDVIAVAVAAAREVVVHAWEASVPVPPAILWAFRLDEAVAMAQTALNWPLPALHGQRSYGEIVFGNPDRAPGFLPWDTMRPVPIPGTGFDIRGWIDRLDVSADGRQARVVDYKTGKPRDPGELAGGAELQRCLYAFAAQTLLGENVAVEAALLYPREGGGYHPLANRTAVLSTLTNALLLARASLVAGHALPGPDTGGQHDPFRFVLPAAPGSLAERKEEAARVMLGEAAAIWEAE